MIIFDMDGVLVEVTESYRESIVRTVEHFTGKRISRDLIQDYKNTGGWNNDWALSHRMTQDHGVVVPYDTVVTYFQKIFFGANNDGLITKEKWIALPGVLERLSRRYRFSIFTGRLRGEAQITLKRFAKKALFDPVVGADDVLRGKPDPEGLLKIANGCDDTEFFYIGDTVDDARSAEAAGMPFIGIVDPSNTRYKDTVLLLEEAGALAVIDSINQLEAVLKAQ